MSPDTVCFLETLFSGCTSGYLTLTAIHPAKNRAAPSRHLPLGDAAALHDALTRLEAMNALGWGAFFAVAPRRADLGRGRRGGRDDLLALPALFVDVDGPPEDSLRTLRSFDPPPSCLVRSSHRGIHAYWCLDKPTSDFALADALLQGLARRCGGDPLTVAQSLRLVGSRNTKPGREGARCQILELHPDRRYPLEAFRTFADRPKPRPSVRPIKTMAARHLNAALVNVVTDCLLTEYSGRFKANGYLAALCPCPHHRDFPGAPFNSDPARGVARCFGTHGFFDLQALCRCLHLNPRMYGGLYV